MGAEWRPPAADPGRQRHAGKGAADLNYFFTIKNNVMTKSNLEFLNDDLKYLGFGERSLLNQHLEAQICRELPSFELFTEAFFDSDTKLEAKLYFTRATQTDQYYLNKYDTLLRYAGDVEKDRAQTFYINKGRGITYKEAFNLLQGRWVYKTLTSKAGIQYTSWIKLNFDEKDKRNNYVVTYFRGRKYELEEVLKKHEIRDMNFDNLRENLVRALQRGNIQPVTFDGPDRRGRHFVEANPMLNTINIYPMTNPMTNPMTTGVADVASSSNHVI
jgi:hypothetical protein